MDQFLRKLKNSTPSLNESESYDKVVNLLTSNDFIVCSSTVLGFDDALALAHYFIDVLAVITLPNENTIPALQPLHVLHFVNPDKPEYTTWGLYYQNGSVFYTESRIDSEDYHIMILLDKKLKDELNLVTEVFSIEETDPE
jgi:hypothetical protein